MQILHKYEYRTKRATTPLEFVSEEEAKAWKAEIAQRFPDFAKTINLYKVTITITEELIHDNESENLPSNGAGDVVLEESVDSSNQGGIPEL